MAPLLSTIAPDLGLVTLLAPGLGAAGTLVRAFAHGPSVFIALSALALLAWARATSSVRRW